MDKEAKKEKEVGNEAERLNPRLQVVLDAINNSSEAKRALQRLIAGGCDRLRLLTALYWYCGNIAKEAKTQRQKKEANDELQRRIEAVRMDAENFEKRLGDLSNQLNKVAGEVDRMLSELKEKMGIIYHDPEIEGLPSIAIDFAKDLKRCRTALKKSLRDMRRDEDGTIEGGRKQYLFYLACLAREVTMQPYPLIARLVSAVRGEKEPDYFKLANTLLHKVERYADKYPLGCMMLGTIQQRLSRFGIRNPKAAQSHFS
jgi:hypothetical protein